MDCKNSIVQWNCNGFFNSFQEIKVLDAQYNPMVICLQETHLKHRNSASFKNFDLYRCDFTSDNDRARGGVMTLVRSQFVSRRFNVDTVLQVVVVELLYLL